MTLFEFLFFFFVIGAVGQTFLTLQLMWKHKVSPLDLVRQIQPSMTLIAVVLVLAGIIGLCIKFPWLIFAVLIFFGLLLLFLSTIRGTPR